MYLKDVVIQNWQCIEKADVNPERLTVLIGPPNQGKSSVISAILYFLDYRQPQDTDFRDPEVPMEVMGILSDLTRDEKKTFASWLFEETVSLKKVLVRGEEERYEIFTKERVWEAVGKEVYRKLVANIEALLVSDRNLDEERGIFFDGLLKMLERRNYAIEPIAENLRNVKARLMEMFVSRGLTRKLVLEALKLIAEEYRRTGRALSDGILLFVEEPELYLHPQASKELYDIFQTLARMGFQIFLATHSGNFVNLKDYKSICIVRDGEKGTEVFQYKGNLFSGDEIQNFNMSYWINPDRSELFFASRVILVEGQTDKIVLGALAKKLGVFRYDYSIIECGSKGLIPQFIRLLNAFAIPCTAVYDKDNHGWRTEEEIENSNSHNREIRKMIHKEEDFTVEFENDIEEEIYNEKRERKNYKNKPFYALQAIMREDYQIPPRLKGKVLRIFE
ncbi:MAG: AAA family ATPase [Fusobacteriaceae bacterium]|jgi:putative ATP-dependent endonuclease of OLD family|nr:AAA family ATPase [Fusobacteriaceae bacterium]